MGNAISVRRKHDGRTAFDTFDKMFAPLFQQSVGFDRLFDTMNSALREANEGASYPPYDIVQTTDDDYQITVALAGFTQDDIEVKLDNGVLSVSGDKRVSSNGIEAKYVHRGIANRKFQHRFRLTDHIRVVGASLKNGLLNIDLHRELPEALKPRTIEITTN